MDTRKHFFGVSLALSLTACLTSQALPVNAADCVSACKSWLTRTDIAHSRVGVEVMELPAGKVIFESDGVRRATPASTAKVVTTSCIYDLLGPNYVYHTRLVSSGTVTGNVLKGDLILETSQDPSLSRDDLVRLVRDAGITKVEGNVFVACPADGHDNYAVSWLVEDFGQDWMPVSSNLVVDRNIAFVSGLPRQLRVSDSKGTGLAILDTLVQSGIGAFWLSLDPNTNIVTISRGTAYGSNGKIDPSVKKDGPYVVANPDAYNAAIFQSILNDQHIVAASQATVVNNGFKEGQVLADHTSKPLSQLIKHCLHESDNLYAQQLLRTIALSDTAKLKSGKPVRTRTDSRTLEEKGLLRVGEWLSSIGVPGREVVLFDGCGLSRKDCITPHALNLIFKHMAGESISGPYLDLLRATGESGSSYRFKTGAMETVRAISGILINNYKQTEAVTIIINGHTPSVKELRIAISDLIERLKNAPINHDGSAKAVSTVKPTRPAAAARPATRHRHRH